MKLRAFLILTMLAGLSLGAAMLLSATQEAGSDLPRYICRRATGQIRIDGKINEAAWNGAQAVSFQFPWEKGDRPRYKTIARALWDNKNLYISFDCPGDPDITAKYTYRDAPTYEEDTVEVFIMSDPEDMTSYIGLEMNALGTLYDYIVSNKRLYKQFDLKGVRLKSHVNGMVNKTSAKSTDRDNGWSLEVMIPLADFEELTPLYPPRPGTAWRINFYRLDGLEPDRQFSLWSDVKTPQPNYHVPPRFGYFVFGE
ncbi:MAG: carbohydrate-binding family 9-like protein [Armatimonadetes bacterium]|nr:carbohydrate-binding family 9-like protein [Armatimonadota bacterium]